MFDAGKSAAGVVKFGNVQKDGTYTGNAKKSLFFENCNPKMELDEKQDRKRQNDEVVESLVPAKRFKSDENTPNF